EIDLRSGAEPPEPGPNLGAGHDTVDLRAPGSVPAAPTSGDGTPPSPDSPDVDDSPDVEYTADTVDTADSSGPRGAAGSASDPGSVAAGGHAIDAPDAPDGPRLSPPPLASRRGLTPLQQATAITALRTLPYGGSDDASLALRLSPLVHANVSPVIAALRWGAVMYAMASTVTRANQGELSVVSALAVVLFLTTWRTMRPVRLGTSERWRLAVALADTAIMGAAAGWSGGLSSPFVFCVVAAAVVASFGWGFAAGAGAALGGVAAGAVTSALSEGRLTLAGGQGPVVLATLLLVVGVVSFSRSRLVEAETRRAGLDGQLELLTETNDLLHVLNELARTLPQSLDLTEAMGAARLELRRTFDADVVALAVFDELSGQWIPHVADGCALRPAARDSELPAALRAAAAHDGPLLVTRIETGEGLGARAGSGLYAAARAGDRLVALVGVEHHRAGHYGPRHVRLMAGLSDVLALTIDNARTFARLRGLGAEEERSRIARDLHDRLGQWLSYISFELERIIDTSGVASDELDRLHLDVQSAIDELRDTLRQLRTEVTKERDLVMVARELITRFNQHAGEDLVAELVVSHPGRRVAVGVENELLRILQEALSNVTKHAEATSVVVRWEVGEQEATLTITDNGRGFSTDGTVRDSAYGLVGMRERAGVIGARLLVASQPGSGTTVTVQAATGASNLAHAAQPHGHDASTGPSAAQATLAGSASGSRALRERP
ncbi:MAG: GAF domain-containing sensor histidine kinase, partial [Acidimicrobiales bacterium]